MKGKNSVVEQIMQNPPPAKEGEQVREAVEQERQARTHPAMLAVCLKNGDDDLLAYPLLRHVKKRGGGRKWELIFDDCSVVITGRNLGDKLRDLLRLHKLSFLREGNLIEDDLTPDDKMFIESIEIHEEKEDA